MFCHILNEIFKVVKTYIEENIPSRTDDKVKGVNFYEMLKIAYEKPNSELKAYLNDYLIGVDRPIKKFCQI